MFKAISKMLQAAWHLAWALVLLGVLIVLVRALIYMIFQNHGG
jgi:hypothetical protein